MALILVADDEPAYVRSIRTVLERAGHQVVTALDGAHALEKLREEPIDLAIIDIFMPKLDGMELTARLKRDNPAARVIVVSGGGVLGATDVFEIADRLGADRTLSKPFAPHELLAAVHELLGSEDPLR